MDRLQRIRGEAGGSQDSSLDGSSTNDAFLTANDSSKFYSLSGNSSFDISIKEVDLTPTSLPESTVNETDNIVPELSPIVKKSNVLDGYKIGKQIEAANILSGGVNIFDDNDNSYDGNDLVIDDNVGIDSDDKSGDAKVVESVGHMLADGNLLEAEPAVESKDTEVVLQIDGKNVDAIDIGNGLYLYRKEGQEELAAVQIIDDDQQQPNFKFLKVRENAEGNLEVYEEIEIEVPKEMPEKVEKPQEKRPGHVPIKDISKVICEPPTNKVTEQIKIPKPEPILPSYSNKVDSEIHKEPLNDAKLNLNMKMKMSESRKSPLSFTPISYHSTPNKDGVPLTKTMVDLHLQPSRHSDNVKKTIEVHTDISKQKPIEPIIKLDETKECANTVSEKVHSDVQLDVHMHPTKLEEEKSTDSLDKNKIHDYKTETKPSGGQNLIQENPEKEIQKSMDAIKKTLYFNTVDVNKKEETCLLKNVELINTEEKGELKNELVSKKMSAAKHEVATDSKISTPIFEEVKHSETLKSVPKFLENKTKLSRDVKSDSKFTTVPEIEKSLKTSVSQINFAPEKSSKLSKESKELVANSEIKLGKDENPKNQIEISKSEGNVPVQLKDLKTDLSLKKTLTPDNYLPEESLKTPAIAVNSEIKLSKNESLCTVDQLNECKKQEDDLGKKDIVIEKQEFDPKILNTVEISENKIDVTLSEENVNMNKPIPKVTPVTSKEQLEKSKAEGINCSIKAETKQLPKSSNLPIPTSQIGKKLPVNITSSIVSHKSEITVFSNATSIQHSVRPSDIPKKETNLKPDVALKQNDEDLSSMKPNLHKTGSTPTKNFLVENIVKSPEKASVNKIEPSKIAAIEKKEMKKVDTSSNAQKDVVQSKPAEAKPINNNTTPVPFGKWTEANRQEFLNKFKEVKVPSHSSTTQQLKQANDLNRRDILKKIDIQRQTSNAAAAKAQEIASKMPAKPENPAFTNAAKNMEMQEKISLKSENSNNNKNILTVTETYCKNEVPKESTTNNIALGIKEQRKDINNQDLINKTIEDMLNKPLLPTKGDIDESKSITPDQSQTQPAADCKPSSQSEHSLDAIEMKMNELHGIPFVERPIHELPKVVHNDKKTVTKIESTSSQKTKPSTKVNTVAELLPFSKQPTRDTEIDEDEVIEHEPVTGDAKLMSSQKPKQKVYGNKNSKEKVSPNPNSTKNEVIITEKDFDKFARRNSITYENKITVNFGNKEQCNVVQSVVEKGPVKSEHKNERLPLFGSKPSQTQPLKSNVNRNRISTNFKSDSSNMAYTSTNTKVQQAYNMTLSAKMQKKSSITIIEDKPVKVVFMESNSEVSVKPLNVQGPKLSPIQPNDTDTTLSSCDSLDSDVLDAIDGMRSLDEMKFKTKHQRKQVLTPVEAPDLELIEPHDIDIICSPKKRRKIEHKTEKDSKLIVPKKSYLLGRAETEPVTGSSHNMAKDTSMNHKSAATAIDNLVKAAELIETQSAVALTNETSTTIASNAPVKRGRGRPRKYPISDGSPDKSTPQTVPSPQKKPRFSETKPKSDVTDDDDSSDDGMILENWTMGKINENIVCPICNKLFRSENVVFKHVKHCTGPSPSRSDSDKRSPMRYSNEFDNKITETLEKASEKIQTNQTPKKRKSRDLAPKVLTEEIIVIEDTPLKEKEKLVRHGDKKSNTVKPTLKSKVPQTTSNLVCEFCGKTFRQLSYLVSHKLQHKKEVTKVENAPDNKKTVFSCEVCKKEFRKLHHLVQHRIIHNPTSVIPLRQSRKSSSEQNDKHAKNLNPKQNVDQSAGFRCEPCDKSFRKLHHLVEHRETHDCINRQKAVPLTQAAAEKIESSYQCDVCKKIFKSIELILEHREQHLETSSEKSDDKSCQSALSAKDIIHECALCYMVFPNEHSLNKHTIICQRKKKQTASKPIKQVAEVVIEDSNDSALNSENNAEEEETKPISSDNRNINNKMEDQSKITQKEVEVDKESIKIEEKIKKRMSNEELTEIKDKNVTVSEKVVESKSVIAKITKPNHHIPKPVSTKAQNKQPVRIPEIKKKTPVKDRVPTTVTKRKRSLNMPPPVVETSTKPVESSDDDEIRYMLNPNFVEDSTECKQFMKIRAHKRNSLQLERPNSKYLVKRRTSLQHPPKIPRLKTKSIEHKTPPRVAPVVQKPVKEESVPSVDSDDSDIKYSFPEKTTLRTTEKKTQRKSLAQKRKSLNGIAKRKSMGKTIPKLNPTAIKPFKRRTIESEHRCDCGQLFSSAALLSRHTTLAHTPPRIRRRRSPPPEPSALARRKSPDKPKTTECPPENRKSTIKTKDLRKSLKPETIKSSAKPRRTPLHKCVPMPEKVRKVLEKSAKK